MSGARSAQKRCDDGLVSLRPAFRDGTAEQGRVAILGDGYVGVVVELNGLAPQRMVAGPGMASKISTAVFKLCGQAAIGPSEVASQSWERMRAAISPISSDPSTMR